MTPSIKSVGGGYQPASAGNACFCEYEAWETDVSALRKVKDNMLSAFEALIARRTQRAEELKARMDKHQQNQEGMLAYSMVNLISEKA
jgi:cystathionine beta-lyase/cystathionine gamma-synthase